MTQALSPLAGHTDGQGVLRPVVLVQVLLALLWRQRAEQERVPHAVSDFRLTDRELSVLELLADGLTADAIARRLGISPRTVHAHLSHLYRKLGVSDRMRAVLVGQAAGLVQVDLRHQKAIPQSNWNHLTG